jgi:hypothetical protein
MTKLNLNLPKFIKELEKGKYTNEQIAYVLMCMLVTNTEE